MSNYNGWSNWDTWNANLWLTNDEIVYNDFIKCEDAEEVKELFKLFFEQKALNEYIDGVNVTNVSWTEIFINMIDSKEVV